MAIKVINPGPQTTIQSSPRTGFRHKGVPASGAADSLSLALANRLVGNDPDAPALEITLAAASFRFEEESVISLTGGEAEIAINDRFVQRHKRLVIHSGDELSIHPLTKGARIYVAVSGGTQSSMWLNSGSTYLPAALGGHKGRALKSNDLISFNFSPHFPEKDTDILNTPIHLRPYVGHSWLLRASPGPEAHLLLDSEAGFYRRTFQISKRANRMGAELEGNILKLNSDGRLPSAAVFSGTVQCPPSGNPFLLMADAQTTGGYPRIAQVIRADRHMLGQLRPGDRIQFRRTSPQEAARVLKEKTALFRPWLGDAFQLR